ncbi:HalOD1 output domain-containing protein [Haloprofundus salilacus]|uniref:HalOD1 output domain-containing protein n=1 Tax=Haloprofundus salilacus TaxID=2876190 RepID=UPI003CCCCA3A
MRFIVPKRFFHFTMDRSHSISQQIVRLVADDSATEPDELPPLYHSIDPNALETIIESMSRGHVQFLYAGVTVRIAADGTVELTANAPLGSTKSSGD